MPFLGWPLESPKQIEFADWAIFDAPRDYDGDGVWDDKHEGLDFLAIEGDAVLACRDGQVIFIGDGTSLYGLYVVLDHGEGWMTWYAHLDAVYCVVGEFVRRGGIIASAGNSGNSSGPHLHLTVQHKGFGLSGYAVSDVVDPQDYL